MPKFRAIHTKITQSFDFNEMPDDFTRLLWVLLPLGLDCKGRGIFNSAWIKSKIFPIREDISDKKLLKAMEFYIKRDMVQVYEVDERKYFFVVKFAEYQRGFDKESPSLLPDPVQSNSVPTPELLQSNSSLYTYTYTESESESESEAEAVVEAKIDDDNNSSSWVNKTLVSEFESITKLKAPKTPVELCKWVESLQHLSDVGYTPKIMRQAVKEMTEKKYPIVAPWSIEKACQIVMAAEDRKDAPRPLDSQGAYSNFVNR